MPPSPPHPRVEFGLHETIEATVLWYLPTTRPVFLSCPLCLHSHAWIFSPLFSYIIKTSGKWKYENANTQGDTFEATMEPDKCTDSVDCFSFNLFLVTWFQLWQEIKWKNLHKLLETFPQTLCLKGHVRWWRKMGKSLKLWIESQITEKKKNTISDSNTERNEQIHRAFGREMVCSRLFNHKQDDAQLPIDTFCSRKLMTPSESLHNCQSNFLKT